MTEPHGGDDLQHECDKLHVGNMVVKMFNASFYLCLEPMKDWLSIFQYTRSPVKSTYCVVMSIAGLQI